MRRIMIFIMALLALLVFAGCATTPAQTTAPAPAASNAITVSDPWVRPANPGAAPAMEGHGHGTAAPAETAAGGHGHMSGEMPMGSGVTSAAYMTLANTGAEADYLIAAASTVAETVELHTVTMENNVMQMRPVERIEIPANGQVELKPGGFHVMLIGVTQELKPGDTVRLTLTLEQGGTIEVDAPVRTP